jgi:Cu/Ag efflux pump CusA
MAITVLGGLVSSTLLNLLVLPVLVHRYGGPEELKKDAGALPAQPAASP